MILPDDEIDKEFQLERDGVKALFDIENESDYEENFKIFKNFVIQTKDKYPIPSFYLQLINEYIYVRQKQSQWMVSKIIDFYTEVFPNNQSKIENLEKKISEMEFINDSYIETIMNDDYDFLLYLINNQYNDINESTPLFDHYFTDIVRVQNEISLSGIDIAAFFGSAKCFKYFCMNNVEPNFFTFFCAFMGGSFEIVRILEQKGFRFDDMRYLYATVKFHRYSLTEWLLLNYITLTDTYPEKWCAKIAYNNYEFFFYNVNHQREENRTFSDLNGFAYGSILNEAICKTNPIILLYCYHLWSKYGKNILEQNVKECFRFAIIKNLVNAFDMVMQMHHHIPEINTNNIAFYVICQLCSKTYLLHLIRKYKFDIFYQDENGFTGLHYTLFNDSSTFKRFISYLKIEKPPEPFYKDKLVETLEHTKYYVETLGNSPDVIFNDGETLLYKACERDKIESVKYLLNKSFKSLAISNQFGKFPLETAFDHHSNNVIDYILSCDLSDDVAQNFFYYVCKNGNEIYAKFLLTKFNVDFNKIHENGMTPIIAACLNKRISILNLYAEHFNIAPPPSTIETNIFEATKNNDLESVKYLFENIKFYKDIVDKDKNNTLHICSYYNFYEMAKSLINDFDVDYEAKNNEGKTPLFISCERKSYDVIKILVEEAVASADECDNDGWNSFHIACLNCSLEIIKYLVEQSSASYNEPTQNAAALHPIHIAASNTEGPDIIKYFIKKLHIDKYIRDSNGKTVLHLACQTKNIKVVDYLITKCKFDPEIKDNEGKTPLHYACNRESLDDVIKFLIEYADCNVEAMDNNKETPLIVACKNLNIETIQYLITDRKANKNPKDENGKPLIGNVFSFRKEIHDLLNTL